MDLDILLPFHKVDSYFHDAVNSIIDIKGVSANVIMIDDRIRDNSKKINNLSFPRNFQFISTEGGQGYGRALELGSKHITTEVVSLFNSDDLVHPLRFYKQLKGLENNEINFTRMGRITNRGKKSHSLTGEFNTETYDPIFLTLGSYGANASWLMRREWWDKNSFFDAEPCLDWRIALNHFNLSKIGYINEELYFYRRHASQVTSQKEYSEDEMKLVYRDWNMFINFHGLGKFDYQTFLIIAAPWIKSRTVKQRNLEIFLRDFNMVLQTKPKNIQKNLNKIIRRRLLFSLRSGSNFQTKLRAGFKGSIEGPNLLRDIIYNKFM